MEHFFLAYEEFYLVEEQTGRLLTIKLFESALFIMLIFFGYQSPLFLLMAAVCTRVLTFIVLALHAYAKWRITPSFTVSARYFASLVAGSYLFSKLFSPESLNFFSRLFNI